MTVSNELRGLGLHGMADGYDQQMAASAAYSDVGFAQRVAHLVTSEKELRYERRKRRLIKASKLKYPSACCEDIDYRPGRGLEKAQVSDLITCDWITRRRNVIISGATGSGKTWLSCALAVQAARLGHSIRYFRTNDLLTELSIAHIDKSILRVRSALAKVDLLVLDEFGLHGLDELGREDLLALLDDRLESGSTIISSQLKLDGWHDWIAAPVVADAILDRLIHSAHRINLGGDSMRRLRAS